MTIAFAIGTYLCQQVIGFTATFTTSETAVILTFFLCQGNNKVIVSHLRSRSGSLCTFLQLTQLFQFIVMLDGGCLLLVIAGLVFFLTLDRVSFCIGNSGIVLDITKGIDHILTLATKPFVNSGFRQLRVQIFRCHQTWINSLYLCGEHVDEQPAGNQQKHVEDGREYVFGLFEINILHGLSTYKGSHNHPAAHGRVRSSSEGLSPHAQRLHLFFLLQPCNC